MKISFFTWEYDPFLVGGLGVYSTEITRKFVELGNEVLVYSLNYRNKLPTRAKKHGVTVIRPRIIETRRLLEIICNDELKKWREGLKLFCSILSYNFTSAIDLVSRVEKPEILAFHDWLSAFSGFLLRNKINSKFVFHIHSTEEQRNLGGGSSTIKEIEKEFASSCDKIITVSYSLRNFLIKRGFGKNIEVVYNGCDPTKFNPERVKEKDLASLRKRYRIKRDEKILFFIGRLTWIKGVHNLLKAFKLVLKSFGKVRLIIVGIGEEYPKLVKLAKELGIESKIVFRNEWLDEYEKVCHYALADLCIFPSLTEPFGIVCSEAMAMEKPVVVGASGEVNGFREQVIPKGKERCGTHVNGYSPEDIAWGIQVTLENPDEAKFWGENGRKLVLKKFNWDIAAKQTLKIYQNLLK